MTTPPDDATLFSSQDMPSLDNLRCFVEAARTLNFRAAAAGVHLTPAALGQRIRQLEEQLQTSLFQRTTRRVILTEQGLALLPAARQALAAAANCLNVLQEGAGIGPTELTIGTRHELGLSWLVPMVPFLEESIPGLSIHLYFGSGSDILRRVRNHEIGCGVTSTRLGDPRLQGRKLHEEEYAFVAAPKLLRAKPFSAPEHAQQHALLDVDEQLPLFRYWRDSPGGFDSIRFGRTRHFGTIAAIRTMVLNGAGVAVLPKYFVEKDLKAGRLVPVLAKVHCQTDHFRLLFRTDAPLRSLYERLAGLMLERPLK